VFDTAFHRTLPPHAYRYAVPAAWFGEHHVRRYGFHGTSYAYVVGRAADLLGRPAGELDLIVAHLGNGASITAVHAGHSVETSMGLSPLEGLVMGTRSGDIDPTVISYVAAASGRSTADVIDDLTVRSGLAGLCGASDMRTITARAEQHDPDAALAIDVFAHRAKKYLGAYLAVLGRCDAVVFTGGIGEHSAVVRGRICAGLEGLGIAIDPARNDQGGPLVSSPGSRTAVLVIATDEELEIARQSAAALAADDAAST
jgi:acetate kinase